MQYIIQNYFQKLANRLKVILPKIISPLQGAFIPGSDIHDNIIVAHEVLHSFSKRNINIGTWL